MIRKACILAALLAAASGCTTINTTSVYNGVRVDGFFNDTATTEIENSGWFLFTCIPIASGNPAKPNAVSCKWFRNTVRLKSNIEVLHRHMRSRGVKELANLTSHCEDEKYLVFLLARRAYRTSAVLLRPENEQGNGDARREEVVAR